MTKRLPLLSILTFLLLGILVLRNSASGPAIDYPLIGKPAPDETFKSLDGKTTYRLSELKGQVVVLDFWQTWCGPCLALMPHMTSINDRLKGKGLKVLGVTTETPGDVEHLLGSLETRPSYELVIDRDEKAWEAYRISAIPATVVIGRDGRVRYYDYGMNPEAGLKELEAAIQSAVDEK